MHPILNANESGFTLSNGLVMVAYDSAAAVYELTFPASGFPSTRRCGLEFRYQGKMYTHLDIAPFPVAMDSEETADGGLHITVSRTFGPVIVRQHFTLEPDMPWLLVRLSLEGNDIISSNYLCPLYIQGRVFPLPNARKPRLLYVPYDNDKWIRYKAQEMQTCGTSYEVTAVYDDDTRAGYVIGSVTHDQWKTGITTHGGYGELSTMRVFGGAADDNTRDPYQPHGAVRGKVIASPAVMIGHYADFREGLTDYGRVNARFAPAPKWQNGVIFGWNSWACLTTDICFDAYVKVSETFEKWKAIGYENRGDVYVNYDSFWTNLSEDELKRSVEIVHARGQKAGIYYTPFTCWTHNLDQVVEGTEGRYTWRDLILRDENDNPIPPIAGGYPVDPTHPGNLMRVDAMMKRILALGFDYLKVDFMSHGACEGVHYLRDITTGTMAYHYGLKAMCRHIAPEVLGRPFFLDFSIAPLFPHGYANARRISCDAFGQIYDAEYMLNSLTYGFWQNGTIYNFSDPDHTCLYHSVGRPISEEAEARSRLLASVIGGTVLLLSDDYRNPEAVARSERLLTSEFLDVAREGRAFLPLECSQGETASRFFVREDARQVWLAVFNYSDDPVTWTLPVARIGCGLPENATFANADGSFVCAGPVLSIPLDGRACELLHFNK